MVTRTLEILSLDGISKIFKGYVNKEYCLHGYAPYFDYNTMVEVFTQCKSANDKLNYNTDWSYDKETDTFTYCDLENGEGREYYRGEEIETVDGTKHLYPAPEWMWEIKE